MHWLLIGYMWLFIHRPFEVWPALGDLRVELFYALGMGLVWAVGARKQLTANPLNLAIAAFAAVVLLCAFASSHSEACWVRVENYFKILVFYLLLVTVIRDEKSLRLVVLGFLGVVGVYMLHSLLEFGYGRHVYRMGTYRMTGVDSSASDPNAFAASLVLAIPFVPVVWRACAGRAVRVFLTGFLILTVLSVSLTGSRGGFVLLLIALGLVIWTTRSRKYVGMAALAAAPLLFLALPDQLQNRFETIVNPDVGPKNAQTSAQGRLDGLTVGYQLWLDNPLTGVGPGAWRAASGRELEAHNLYGQLIGELGSLGGLAFAGIICAFVVNLIAIRRGYHQHPEWEHDFLFDLARAVGFALFLLLLQGGFGHNLFRYNWVWFGAFLVLARQCVEERARSCAAPWAFADHDSGEVSADPVGHEHGYQWELTH